MSRPSRKVFVNLAVAELPRAKAFFEALGFAFDPHFSDQNAACMVLGPEGYVMLLTEPFFRGFTKREPCDTKTHSEALVAVSCESRAEVDDLFERALAAGGSVAMPTQDHGFMYARPFYDLDGHHWEPFWMDPAAIPPA